MKILYALDSYRPNIDGVGISTERQALGLAQKGHEVAIVAPGQRLADYEEEGPAAIKIYRVRSMRMLLNRWRLAVFPTARTESIIDQLAPDIVVVSLPLPLNLTALNVSRKRQITTVGITGTMPEWLIYSFRFLRPFAKDVSKHIWRRIADFYNRCDAVVAVTPTAMGLLQQHGLSRPVHVISNGVDLRQFRRRRRDEELARRLGVPRKPAVLYAGRLDSEKRMDVWIRAIPLVLEKLDVHFIIVGDGWEREHLMAMATKLGVEDHVSFPGFLDPTDYCKVYSLAHVFAISSPAELQSIVTLEAAASGLPIVAANAGALPELVEEGRNGYLFSEGDSTELACKLLTILGESDSWEKMGRESRHIAEKHDIERSVVKYEALYRSLVQR